MTHRAGPASTRRVMLTLSLVFLAVIALLLVVLPLAGIAGPTASLAPGAALAGDRIDPPPDSGVAIRRVPDRPTGPRSGVENAAVVAIVDDLQTYWAAELPQVAATTFTPLRGGVTAIDSAASSASAPCVSTPAVISGNAYYCPGDDGIVFDSSALVPVLLGHYGSAGLVAAFAHEFGHAIQARIGPTAKDRAADPSAYPSLLIEGQGDCYAGAFLAWVIAGNATSIHLTEDAMLQAIGPLVDFRDPVTVPADDSTAHGLGLDRLDSLLTGYRDGAAACHAMTVTTQQAIQGTVPVPAGGTAAMTKPRYSSTAAALQAAATSIESYTGTPVTATADPADLAAAAPYGQFAQATALALAVGHQRAAAGSGAGSSPDQAGIEAACFAGAWAASVYGHAPTGSLGSWPGDADEGLDLVRSRPGTTFAEVAGYADGFRSGLSACS